MIEQNQLSDNKALVARFLNALSQMRLEEAAQMIHEDCMFYMPTVSIKPNNYTGEGMLEFVANLKHIIPDGIRFEVVEMTAEQDRVATIVDGFSTTIDGQPYNNHYHFLHSIKNGKIFRQTEFFDSYLGAKVLGPLMGKLAPQ